jgi:UTP:GlnB (protein PII) uridylyltransferase
MNPEVAESYDLSEFLASMPVSYRIAFSSGDARQHAAIVARRGARPIHVELWRSLPSGGATLCIVAEDRPALLSLIGAGLVEFRLDVTSAEIYCRTPSDSPVEAVDLFWVRATEANGKERPIETAEIVDLSARLEELVNQPTHLERHGANGESLPPLEPIPTSRVFFETKALESGLSVLVVEAHDRPGLLLSLVRVLHRQGVDIVASEIRTEGHHVRDRFTIVDDRGSPLTPERRTTIEEAVRRALATRTKPSQL